MTLDEFLDSWLPERWTRRFEIDASGCWIWTGRQSWGGYGQTTVGKRHRVAHRAIYEVLVGPIPEGLQLDHLCRVRNCVNPAHLEPVTQRENVLRGVSPTAIAASRTHCPQGHPYHGDNLYQTRTGGRQCRQCHNDREINRRLADPEAGRARSRHYDKVYRDKKRAEGPPAKTPTIRMIRPSGVPT